MRECLIAFLAGVMCASGASAQSASAESGSEIDEITVHGQRSLGALRFEVQSARERVYDLFNELIDDDSLSIHCAYERRSGTRIPQRECRPRYSHDATGQAGRDFVTAVFLNCGDRAMIGQEAIFDECGHTGVSHAQAAHGYVQLGDQRLVAEVQRLARDSPEFRRAIYRYQVLELEYDSRRRGQEPVVTAQIMRLR